MARTDTDVTEEASAFLFSSFLRKAARASPRNVRKSISKPRNAHQWR